jgi:hypothetical protein
MTRLPGFLATVSKINSNLFSAHRELIFSEFPFTLADGSLRPAIRLPAGGHLADRPGAAAGFLLA